MPDEVTFQKDPVDPSPLAPVERMYGCGGSFTRLDKRGQLLHMWTRDAYSAQTNLMYKPVPFLLSGGGWGEVVSEYTWLTGRACKPPRWSFGLWVGRDTYESAGEVRTVARRLREERVPCEVLHVDTGWTEVEYLMDFAFSRSRFPEPERFLAELREQGFRLSLWHYPVLVRQGASLRLAEPAQHTGELDWNGAREWPS